VLTDGRDSGFAVTALEYIRNHAIVNLSAEKKMKRNE
jgi:hypothetical protein